MVESIRFLEKNEKKGRSKGGKRIDKLPEDRPPDDETLCHDVWSLHFFYISNRGLDRDNPQYTVLVGD